MSYTSFNAKVRHAQAAERGKLQFLFLPDGPTHVGDLANEPPHFNLDVMVTLAVVVRETKEISLVATGSTTFYEPFNLALQCKALDVISHGWIDWNAVTSSGEDVAANYCRRLPSSADRYERAHETVQLVQALWGSWGRDSWVHDQTTGRFAEDGQGAPIDTGGIYVASRGLLYIPPSEQGQPVVFYGGENPNANAVVGAAFMIDEIRAERNAFRASAEPAGRNPHEIKFFTGLTTTIASDRREALDRRIGLSERIFPQRAAYLAQMLVLRIGPARLDEPLSPEQLAKARASPADPRSSRALNIAREGWRVRDVLAGGVIDYHPFIAGPAVEAADHMQQWFDAGAVDGFWVSPDVCEDRIDPFVGVVPILQDRRLFHKDYPGVTLRNHLGAPAQYGIDPRVAR